MYSYVLKLMSLGTLYVGHGRRNRTLDYSLQPISKTPLDQTSTLSAQLIQPKRDQLTCSFKPKYLRTK